MSPTRAEKLAAMYRRDEEWRNARARGRSRVSPVSRVFGRLILGGVAVYSAMAVLSLFMVQQLVRARVGIVGESTSGERVTLTASLPPDYGLTPSEQRAGWEALNQSNEQHVPLGERFTVEFPRVTYCVTRFLWTPPPPPPAGFVLRFSDAPAEEYRVWRSRAGQSGYVVLADGIEVPPELAAWKLDLGPFERATEEPALSSEHCGAPSAEQGARRPLWLLRVRFERQPSPASARERLS